MEVGAVVPSLVEHGAHLAWTQTLVASSIGGLSTDDQVASLTPAYLVGCAKNTLVMGKC